MSAAKAALITGASSGIGAAFARKLAARGFDLILVARRRARLEELAEELEHSYGVWAQVFPADLTAEADLVAVEKLAAGTEVLELLINNAGFGTQGRFYELDLQSQDRMHRLHVMAAMRLTHAALPGMVARRKGGVINVSSVAAFANTPGSTSYCATKAWMKSFSETLALELEAAGSPVRVQALCPGFTYTEFHDVMGFDRKLVPKGWWTSVEKVVAASLRGLKRGKPVVIPGIRYQALVLVLRYLPRFLMRAGVRIYAHRMKRA